MTAASRIAQETKSRSTATSAVHIRGPRLLRPRPLLQSRPLPARLPAMDQYRDPERRVRREADSRAQGKNDVRTIFGPNDIRPERDSNEHEQGKQNFIRSFACSSLMCPSAPPRSIRISPQFPQKQQRKRAWNERIAILFIFFIASLCILCVTSCSSFEPIYGAFHHNAIAAFHHWQSKPQVCASHSRFLTPQLAFEKLCQNMH
jgi:hypothetical protein